jgi:Arc/MetJ-type ribon-helix-helix transcriptional regulator
MSTNPHYARAKALVEDVQYRNESELLRAQIDATLALVWETARCADEAHTANIIASLKAVRLSGSETAFVKEDAAMRKLDEIHDRLYPEGTPE